MMMKLLVVLCTMLSASAFNPLGAVRVQKMQMAAEKPSMQKLLGVALVASSMFAGPVLAKEGAGANIEIFGNNGASSPFSDAKTYSPYSPYGDGTNAVYNGRKGSPEETKFWTEKFNECIKRTEKIPAYTAKKTWSEITTELTRYTYNLRESMLRLASTSKNPKDSLAAAKIYFSDINDIFEFAVKKRPELVTTSYEKSVKDLAAFRATLK